MKTTTQKPATLIEQVNIVVKKHVEALDAILKDYSYGTEEGLDTELRACIENLENWVEGLIEDEEYKTDAEKFEEAIKVLKDIDAADFDTQAVLNLLGESDVEDEEFLKRVDEDAIWNHIEGKGFACINLQGNQDNRTKLEHFITTAIYPFYHDQTSFVHL